MGSEGWSGWQYYSVAFGDTDEEIYNNWVKNVKKIYAERTYKNKNPIKSLFYRD
jgi:hypothetical protein